MAASPKASLQKRHPTQPPPQVRNVHDLARVITTEAGGEGEAAMVAVGWTLRTRMLRDVVPSIHAAWGGYQHGHPATSTATRIATGIMAGTIPDPTNGATHFYTPRIMPKKGDTTSGIDVSGGLENVPGVKNGGRPVQNYRPGWTLTFEQKIVSTVPEAAFKFYKQPGTGHVR